MVALSYYDNETVRIVSENPLALTLVFYDVTLIRKAGHGYVGYKVLFSVSDVLGKFMDENEDAVLCFYCDADTDVRRNHRAMPPQEYRSRLFSRMFDMYVKSRGLSGLENLRVEMEEPGDPANRRYAHFICREEHKDAVAEIGRVLMSK